LTRTCGAEDAGNDVILDGESTQPIYKRREKEKEKASAKESLIVLANRTKTSGKVIV
jgi:hypothetical protein